MKAVNPKKIIEKLIPGKKHKKTALILEGGAMRCVFTSGVLDAIQERTENKFDFILSVSAAAGCAMSFMAGQKGRSQKIFINYLSTSQFIDFRRFLKGSHIMDLGYAIREINEKLVPVDMNTFEKSKTKFYTVLTEAETGKAEFIQPDQEELTEALIAACNLPYLTRAPIVYRGKKYVDGGVATPIPLQQALEMGAERIVVVMTRPHGFRKDKSPFLVRMMGSFFNEFSHLKEMIEDDYINYNRDKSFVESFVSDQVELICVEPPQDFPVERLTTRKDLLTQGYSMGVIEGIKLLEKL